jgi:hypothetical protein
MTELEKFREIVRRDLTLGAKSPRSQTATLCKSLLATVADIPQSICDDYRAVFDSWPDKSYWTLHWQAFAAIGVSLHPKDASDFMRAFIARGRRLDVGDKVFVPAITPGYWPIEQEDAKAKQDFLSGNYVDLDTVLKMQDQELKAGAAPTTTSVH